MLTSLLVVNVGWIKLLIWETEVCGFVRVDSRSSQALTKLCCLLSGQTENSVFSGG